jgi:adhesin transport system outer membrane protein
MNMAKLRIVSAFAAALALFSATAWAQAQDGADPMAQPMTLKEAAQAAVLNNPEVQARWHAFREADEEIGVARGEFLPKIDLSAGVGRTKTVQKRIDIDNSYHGNETTLTLRQMLFDGFVAYNEVKRLGKAKLVRYFELLDASENTALEAVRAYLDVIRYREQVKLAEDNYLQHYAAHEQLKQRASSGIGKQVDVNQAASRLALADVNVVTAYANLHDVTARYLRIVGTNPPKEMSLPERMDQSFPDREETALAIAMQQNPALRASLENIEAAQYDLNARRGAFMPRLDLIGRRDHYSNYEDNGSRDDSRVELRLNYNLFNGGSDTARSRQYRERKYIALDLRDKACRDMRQTLAIAYNDTSRLNDQLNYLAMQVELVSKTRTAYRDQFNIGQRTLLDLLNTQNEYFDARRAQVNANTDLLLAYLRSYAGMGRLLEMLGLKHVELENAPTENDFAAVDSNQLCPPLAPVDVTLDREALRRQAQGMSENEGFIGTRTSPVTPARNGVPGKP